MYKIRRVDKPKILCQLHDHAKQYDNDGMCHNKTERWKLHGNISRNCYGNAIIVRYGGCFDERYKEGLMHRRKLHGTGVASKGGRVKIRIIHGLNISHKELTYLLQKIISHRSKVLIRMPLGG